ncbi:hypothetical protein [Kitasatospora terrestris]|uniref:DUF4232 domain-containing protein n=1 Tax=Kitasatospora terrestris TaxID=258051 RepID=A0ABP9EFL3_9ACTN
METVVEVAEDVTTRQTPAHARPGLRHWALVAAGCAAVVGGALAATSATGAVTTAHPAAPAGKPAPVAAPDPAQAELPLDCGPFPVAVSLKAGADLGRGPVTVVAAHCQADLGTPPDAVYLLVNGPGKPQVAATLVEDTENLTVTQLAIRSDGTVRARAKGYSSDDVPRFAPDLDLQLNWAEKGGQWVRSTAKAAAGQV